MESMSDCTSQGVPKSLPVRPDYPAPEETGWTKRTIDRIAAEIA